MSSSMSSNLSMRYGFRWDRDFLIDFSMRYQSYLPFVNLLIHPIMQYLLIFEDKSMKKDIRILYILTHLGLVLNEWSFCFAFRITMVFPYAALYCEGPLCRAGINKQILMTLIAIPKILIISPYVPLSSRLRQMFLPIDSKWRMSASIVILIYFRSQIFLAILVNFMLVANVFGFGYFGRDHDEAGILLKQEPELAWLTSRGGTLFLFGPPGDPQYFRWELLILGSSILAISPALIFLTVRAMRSIAETSANHLSAYTQERARRMLRTFFVQSMGSLTCYVTPLIVLLLFMIIDVSTLPALFLAFMRMLILTLFTLNSHQFCMFFIIINPLHRKIVAERFKQILTCTFTNRKQSIPITPQKQSTSSRQF